MCPGTNGACIYQARALYNTIFGQEVNYEGCGEASGNRAANNSNIENVLEVGLFPNPASNKLTIITKNEKETLKIEIRDVGGRVVLLKNIVTKNQEIEIDLNLLNGIYFVTLCDSENRINHEKLLIAK